MRRNWSDGDKANLRKLAKAGFSPQETALHLGRTLDATRTKASTLGVSFRFEKWVARDRSNDSAATVRLDPETMGTIDARAKAEKTTRSAIIRDLIEWGLMAGQDGQPDARSKRRVA